MTSNIYLLASYVPYIYSNDLFRNAVSAFRCLGSLEKKNANQHTIFPKTCLAIVYIINDYKLCDVLREIISCESVSTPHSYFPIYINVQFILVTTIHMS